MEGIKKYRYILLLLSTFLFVLPVHNLLFAKPALQRVEINPLNRAIFYFSELPGDFKSELSPDKTSIKLVLTEVSSTNFPMPADGSGIISNISFGGSRSLEITIKLKDKRGYTVASLPYSRSLSVEVFDWKNLSPAEDSYRTALLALEDGIRSSARRELNNAARGGVANAAAHLGIMNLSDGRIPQAIEMLKSAEKGNSNIPDVFAALSQAYNLTGDLNNARVYRDLFLKKTGLSHMDEIPVSNGDADDISDSDTLSFLSSMLRNDTLADAAADDSTKPAGDTIVLSRKMKQTEPAPSEKKATSMPDLNKYLIYGAVAVLFMVLILLSSYRKWRKNQIAKRKARTAGDFEEKLANAQSTITGSAHAANLYKKNAGADNTAVKTAKKEDEQTKPPMKGYGPQKTQPLSQEKVAESLERLAKEIIATKAKEIEETKTREASQPVPDKNPLPPKLELALHLQEEQERLKQKNLQSFVESELPEDLSKVADVAKKFGIGKGAVEARKNISNIQSDDATLSKLARKFSVNRKNK